MATSFVKKRNTHRIGLLGVALGILYAGQLLNGCDSGSATEPAPDPNAEIVITSPKGGERLLIGDTLRLKWIVQGKGVDDVNAVNIELSPDSGKTWVGLINKSVPVDDVRWGDFPWKILPSVRHLGVDYDLAGDSHVMLRVMQYSTPDPNKIAVTKKPFSIAAK